LAAAMPELTGWTNFYAIVGSAAGALIGLQFVVMTLIANVPIPRSDAQAGDAFSTPTVAHFSVVLLLTAAGAVPWDSVPLLPVIWGIVGVCGVGYVVLVACRMRSQTAYQAVFEDWLFHALLPLHCYIALAASACVAFDYPRIALFLVAGAALLLLFIGIHNSWDIIRYHVFVRSQGKRESEQKE
jgi:hypothetical protein